MGEQARTAPPLKLFALHLCSLRLEWPVNAPVAVDLEYSPRRALVRLRGDPLGAFPTVGFPV